MVLLRCFRIGRDENTIGFFGDQLLPEIEGQGRECKTPPREIVVKNDDVNWEEIIEQAEFLPQHEQERLRVREKRWRAKQRKKAERRTKRYGTSRGRPCLGLVGGSFSNNLLRRLNPIRRTSNSSLDGSQHMKRMVELNGGKLRYPMSETESLLEDKYGDINVKKNGVAYNIELLPFS